MRTNRMLFTLAAVMLCSVLAIAQSQQWYIQSADFGANNRRADVTRTVRQLVNSGDNFKVGVQALGVDPAPGTGKSLRIIAHDQNGNVRTFKYEHGERVNTARFVRNNWDGNWNGGGGGPNYGRGLRIIQAEYRGVNGTYRSNVTSTLQNMVSNNRLNIIVNNSTMGGDPAPGVSKQLYVVYQYNGQSNNMTVPENGRLRIP